MMSRFTFVAAVCVLSFGFTYWQEQNSPPKVAITIQGKGNTFQWNSVVPYTIDVTDVEDGKMEYNEILSHEVILVVRYFSDSSLIKKSTKGEPMIRNDAVLEMSKALCFNCHAAKAKLIGPSFEQIAARYKDRSSAVDSLTKKIIDGSTGTWGDLKMPPHPDLRVEEIKKMVTWIIKNNSDPNVTYFAGTQGSFRTKEKPSTAAAEGVYVLTAAYMDHGPKNSNSRSSVQGKTGQHALVLRSLE